MDEKALDRVRKTIEDSKKEAGRRFAERLALWLADIQYPNHDPEITREMSDRELATFLKGLLR